MSRCIFRAAPLTFALWLPCAGFAHAEPQGTSFTYQGELKQAGTPASGDHDFRFRLFDAAAGGGQYGPVLCADNVTVVDGRFSVTLDFGPEFSTELRYLEIDVRTDTGQGCGVGTGFTLLTGRQAVRNAPVAIYSNKAGSADSAFQSSFLNGQPGTFYQNAANLSSGTLASARLAGSYSNPLSLINASNEFAGNGGGLSGLNASNLASGTIPSGRLSGTYSGVLTLNNASNVFAGSGAALIGLNASNVASGTLADARLSTNVATLIGSQTFSGTKTFGVAPVFSAAGAPFSVSGSTLVGNLNADLLDGLHASAFLQAVPNPLVLIGNTPVGVIQGENSSTTTASAGVRGVHHGATGVGVYGQSTNPGGASAAWGGYFSAASSAGRGVFGTATSSTGDTIGVQGRSSSPTGVGVYGETASLSGMTYGVRGVINSEAGAGVYGLALGISTAGSGVRGSSTATAGSTTGGSFSAASTDGNGVFAEATATTGTATGLVAQSSSNAGTGALGQALAFTGSTIGVRGQSLSTSGTGVRGEVTAGSGSTFGVFGQSASTTGTGVRGVATAVTGAAVGVSGETASPAGAGVIGKATAVYGISYGGRFEAASPNGFAIYAISTAIANSSTAAMFEAPNRFGAGVHGVVTDPMGNGHGVEGYSLSSNGTGVYGWADHPIGGSNTGVFGGVSTGTGWGVYSLGRFGASGTKAFRIDHPEDPENKYLLHYSSESPEVINFYRGVIELDAAGEAIVEMPGYFARINTSPSYTLTAMGAPMPMLHIASKIDAESLMKGAVAGPNEVVPVCSFRIAGGAPHAEVSWRVEAVRNDRWVRANPPRVEEPKLHLERGTYQHPELYDQPSERATHGPAAAKRHRSLNPEPSGN